jgi:hypothetical protein
LLFIERMAQIIDQNAENRPEETSTPSDSTGHSRDVSTPPSSAESIALPAPLLETSASFPARLEQLADRARGYIEAASSANTRRAYASDWKHFATWCRRHNVSPIPPDPQVVGLYITAYASGAT